MESFPVYWEYTGRIADHAVGCNCHTGHSTSSGTHLPKGTKAGSDRVNGVSRNTVKSAPDVSGVDIHATNN